MKATLIIIQNQTDHEATKALASTVTAQIWQQGEAPQDS